MVELNHCLEVSADIGPPSRVTLTNEWSSHVLIGDRPGERTSTDRGRSGNEISQKRTVQFGGYESCGTEFRAVMHTEVSQVLCGKAQTVGGGCLHLERRIGARPNQDFLQGASL